MKGLHIKSENCYLYARVSNDENSLFAKHYLSIIIL